MNKDIKAHFDAYPNSARIRLDALRELVFQIATELELGDVSESLKWGEPSYNVKTGSPIRIDWKQTDPNNYYIFFNCQTKLVDTFRELFGKTLEFKGNRAIILALSDPLPKVQIRHCLELAMTYQKCKNLSLLGA